VKVVVRKGMKLDLPYLLAFVSTCPGIPYSSVLIPAMRRRFGCKTRAAQDALRILIEGGWVIRVDDQADRRRKIYVVTDKGRRDLSSIDGWRHLRFARWLHSRTSTRARKRRGLANGQLGSEAG
jgi:DNA-binding MarR family transcriptional regulator